MLYTGVVDEDAEEVVMREWLCVGAVGGEAGSDDVGGSKGVAASVPGQPSDEDGKQVEAWASV